MNNEVNPRRMLRFAEFFSHEAIVGMEWRQSSWSHFRAQRQMKPRRELYADMCRIEGRSLRSLSERNDSMRYQRTALSREQAKPVKAGGRSAAGQGRNYAGDGAQRPERAWIDCGDLNGGQDKALPS
ncbi:MAG: hypothetical protein ACKVQT_07780 [Burkholderiales bacterium]